MNKIFSTSIIILITAFFFCQAAYTQNTTTEILYTFPEESQQHQGTWLQWPHQYQYGTNYRNNLDDTWIAITKELITGEKVHIIAYNQTEKNRIITLLNTKSINLTNIDFKLYQTNDVWIRDNGPIYARDKQGKLIIEDWGFNGWGKKAAFKKCNAIPSQIAKDQKKTVINLNNIMINEGGSIETDGYGTLMACKSSILNNNRNPETTQDQAEKIFTTYLGATNFIWLDGQAKLEITDQHIDGFARFGNSKTIVTMNRQNLLNYDVKSADINKLYQAKNKDGKPYAFLKLPLTKNNVITTYGKNLGYKGSYINFYIANSKILVPIYNDPNDNIAIQKIQTLYPNRKVIGIDCKNLYANGGMIHCVTMQQPAE
ncbi:MAG: agmatine deiminase family protein [Deltaproteobacteria bacterium]|nr:agmatine deiminase family protein [Deltaproteobacteria bacterium]